MKTTPHKNRGTPGQIRKVEQTATAAAPQAVGTPVTVIIYSRLPIDTEARKKNRTLPTEKVLNLLLNKQPEIYRLAEVVGKWVWVTFKEKPAAEIRQQFASAACAAAWIPLAPRVPSVAALLRAVPLERFPVNDG